MPNALNNIKNILPSRKQGKGLKLVLNATRNPHKRTSIKYKVGKKGNKKTGLL